MEKYTQSKNSLKVPLLIFGIGEIIFFVLIIFFLTLDSFAQVSYVDLAVSASSQKVIFGQQINFGLPIRLQIPKIKLNIAVEHVGLTLQGAVGVPKGRANAAWFDLGPRPGNMGSAVVSGHYGRWRDGVTGVFNNLYKLRKGDKIYIQDEKGAVVTFVVRESRSYKPGASVPEVFDLNDNRSHLNLITCEGTWDKTSQTYSKRLVVFADRE